MCCNSSNAISLKGVVQLHFYDFTDRGCVVLVYEPVCMWVPWYVHCPELKDKRGSLKKREGNLSEESNGLKEKMCLFEIPCGLNECATYVLRRVAG